MRLVSMNNNLINVKTISLVRIGKRMKEHKLTDCLEILFASGKVEFFFVDNKFDINVNIMFDKVKHAMQSN